MPIYTDRKTGRFFIQFDFEGRIYKRRLPAGIEKKKAESLEAKMRSDLLLESFGIDQKKDIGFTEFLYKHFLPFAEKHYSTAGFKNVQVICKAILPFVPHSSIRKVESRDIERFKEHREKLKTKHKRFRKPATIHRELNVVSKIFNLAVKEGFLEFNPCKRITLPPVDNVQNEILTDEQIDRFLKSIRTRWLRDVVTVILNTGLRQNDALGLRKENVDFEKRTLTLVQGKSKRRVTVPLNETAYQILFNRRANGSDLFFPSPRGGGQATSIKIGLRWAAKRAKLNKNIGSKILRRTFGTKLDEMNYSPSVVAKLLGHSDLRSVHRYKRGTDILRTAVDALDKDKNAKILPDDKNE
jgi:integrase